MSPILTGAARVGGVAGNPIAHSLSPAIHNAWIAAAGLDAAYVPFAPRDAEGFAALISAGRAGLLAGLNVTAPFKEPAFASADVVANAARAAGSANLLTFYNGRIRADSTDGAGLLAALAEQAPDLRLSGARAVVLGAGGAARAAIAALASAGAQVAVVNRTRERAEALANDLAPIAAVTVADYGDVAKEADLVVNALSAPPEVDLSVLSATATVMDMSYRPVATPFLAQARARGLTTVDGLAMLIGQARPSFEAIFGQVAPDLDPRPGLLLALGEAG